jgi:hypothetical protein
MVQVVENRAHLVGEVVGARADEARPGHHVLRVKVTRVEPRVGYPNLLAGLEGSTVDILSPQPPPAGDGPVRLTVKRGGPGTIVAVPD